MKHHDWHGLYRESWGAEIVPDAFSHPAKYGRGLIRAIYQHALASGYIAAGDTIVDPFGGVGLGSLDAMRYGLHWRGVELEPHFVALAQANIDLWNQRYAAAFATWGTAQIHQGDSRQLTAVLGDAAAVVSSPPYASDTVHGRGGIDLSKTQRPGKTSQAATMDGYGTTPGQLSSMPVGAVVSSPPYSDSVNGGEGPGARFDAVHHAPDNAQKKSSANGYGTTPGNLGRMAGAVVSSPPFESVLAHNEREVDRILIRPHNPDPQAVGVYIQQYREAAGLSRGDVEQCILGRKTALCYRWEKGDCLPNPEHWLQLKKLLSLDSLWDKAMLTVDEVDAQGKNTTRHRGLDGKTYGHNPGNIGNNNGPTFWAAARAIVEQAHAILRPGGVAIWVCGDYVRGGQRVPFGQQWLDLCCAVGFTPVEWIKAWKIEPGPVQLGLLGEDKDMTVERVSFFRRLSNQRNPAAAILNEDVIVVRR